MPHASTIAEGIKEMPTPKAISNRRTRYIRSIEERFGKTFKTILSQLEEHLNQLPRDKHRRIRTSLQRLAVIEMVLADIPVPQIRDFLRRADPVNFSPGAAGDDALRKEIRRFADDVIAIAAKGEEDAPLSLLDIYRRLPDGNLPMEQRFLRVILMQEDRLDRILKQEQDSDHLLPDATKELGLYFRFLVSFAHWQFMHLPYGDSQRECMDKVLELRRYRD